MFSRWNPLRIDVQSFAILNLAYISKLKNR